MPDKKDRQDPPVVIQLSMQQVARLSGLGTYLGMLTQTTQKQAGTVIGTRRHCEQSAAAHILNEIAEDLDAITIDLRALSREIAGNDPLEGWDGGSS